MKLGIITPVGPGHEKIIDRCNLSISEAQNYGLGTFRSIERIIIDDTKGQLGRSAARNLAIFQALELQCDWIYFIDADDVMVDTAFVSAGKYLSRFDAIWGQIFETPSDDLSLASKRPNQLATITKLFDILTTDPYLTLQMGFFIKTKIAAAIKFDERMNAGEDFKFYLEVWKNFTCIKTEEVFFVNARGSHSQGPKSANGLQWRQSVESILLQELELLKDEFSGKRWLGKTEHL